MWSGGYGLSGVVQEQCEIKNKRILQLFKKFLIRNQLGIVGTGERVELVDANQRVFVGRVTMEIFVLHEAGQLAEFRNVTAQKIDAMHHAQHASNLVFARQDRHEHFPRRFRILKRAVNETERPTQ